MKFIKNITERIERWRKFYQTQSPEILVSTGIADIEQKLGEGIPNLSHYNIFDETEHKKYLDDIVDNYTKYLSMRPDIDDDFLPRSAIYYGQALFSGQICDRAARFIDGTSWMEPCINEWTDLDKIQPNENNRWYQLYMSGSRYLQQKMDGIGFVCAPNDYGPMDLANALRGNELFVDFYNDPEKVHQLMDVCTKALIWVGDAKRNILKDAYGGGINPQGVWSPGKTGFMSVDASIMISPEMFAKFELPYIQRIVDHCGGYTMHLHTAWHQFENYAKLENIQSFQLVPDPSCKAPTEDFDSILNTFGLAPLMIYDSSDNIRKNIDFLRRGKLFIHASCKDERDAYEIVEFIREAR